MGGTDQLVNQYADSAAHTASQSASNAVNSLLHAFVAGTEPDFTLIVPVYDRMLAIALLICGAIVGLAVIERMLGGSRGAAFSLLPRTLAAVTGSIVSLSLVQYLAHYTGLLAHAWDPGWIAGTQQLIQHVNAAYAVPATAGAALGSAVGLILMSLLTVFLVVLLLMELVLRSALLLVTTAFIPLVCVMAIWPRLSPALTHLVEFLVALLLSKFVIVTAVYIGFTMVVAGSAAPAADATGSGAMVVGLATLLVALLSPAILLQGIRFTHTAGATAVRGWSLGTFRSGAGIGARAATRARANTARSTRRPAESTK